MKFKELMDDLNLAFFTTEEKDPRFLKGWVQAFVTFDHVVIDAYNREQEAKKAEEQKTEQEKAITGNDPVNHPSHYTAGKIEVIDFLEDQKFPYHLGNAVKYICRAGKKNPEKTVEDLQKAVWYLNRYIGLLQEEGDPHEG